ncbi:unnamed protein product, partial [Ilex paraguariensis]
SLELRVILDFQSQLLKLYHNLGCGVPMVRIVLDSSSKSTFMNSQTPRGGFGKNVHILLKRKKMLLLRRFKKKTFTWLW